MLGNELLLVGSFQGLRWDIGGGSGVGVEIGLV